jgi:hypothetical protein
MNMVKNNKNSNHDNYDDDNNDTNNVDKDNPSSCAYDLPQRGGGCGVTQAGEGSNDISK